MIPKFFLRELQDDYSRENFKKLADWFVEDPLVKAQFKFFTLTPPDNTLQVVNHSLGYQPKDVILLAISGGQTVVFSFDSFTATTISFTASGACTIRCLLGTYA